MKFNNHIYFILNTAKYKDSENPLVSSNTHFTKNCFKLQVKDNRGS